MVLTFKMPSRIKASANFYSAFSEAGAKQTIKANQMAEIKHYGCQSFRLQVVSPTSRFAYIEVVSPTRPSRFAYTI